MKKTTKKSPTGAPLGNPLKFFREGGEKIKTMFKKGGATKATKFAALAPPFNKATAADRIAGAKKNVRKKK